MKVLIIHNKYTEHGGEDEVVRAESTMLKKHGHEVFLYERSNAEFVHMGQASKLRFVLRDIYWSEDVYRSLRAMITKHAPDIAHVHNIFFMATSSVYDACYDERLPIVQTMHNYRFFCINGLFFRDGAPCEACLRQGITQGIIHKCWRGSYLASYVAVNILSDYSKRRIFDKVSCFIALSRFSMDKFLNAGIPKERLYLKPNYIADRKMPRTSAGDYALFIGRLADYKGIRTVIDAFKICRDCNLKIIGSGPLAGYVKKEAMASPNIEFIGPLVFEKAMEYLANAACLISASTCYETFGRTVVEAYALGVPVLVSNGGALEELVLDGKTGYIFERGNSNQLAEKVSGLFKHKDLAETMGHAARKAYEDSYTEELNYARLMDVYMQAISNVPAGITVGKIRRTYEA